MTESEKLVMGVESEALLQTASARESWRIFGIMSEFVEATERLAAIKPAVTIFGSARIKPGTPYYDLAEKTARLLSDSGFSVISGGGPGIMGGFGTLDELMEALTLIQTGKARKIPLILVCTPFWQGLIDWFKERLVEEGLVDPEDMNLIQLIDEPEQVVEAIFKHYEARPFGPLPNERELMLNL